MTEDDMASSSDTSLDAHLNGRRRITEATLSPPSNNPISLLSSPQGEEQDSSPATVLNQKHEQEVEEKRDKASASLAGKITAADSVSGSSEFDGLVKETNISGEEVQETEDASVNVVEERAFSKSVEKDEFLAKGVEEEDSLEVRKKRLLAELEAMSMQGDKEAHLSKVTEENSPSYSSSLVDEKRNLCKDVIIKMVKNEAAAAAADKIGVTGGPLRSSLEFEVIDETALIGSVLVNRKEKYGTKKTTTKVFPRKVQVELLENNVNVNFNVDGPTKKISRRRAKEAERKTKGMNQEENVDMSSNGGKRKYSRGQMESLRFVKVFEQRKLWKEIYEGLGPDLAKEYDGLTVSFNSSTFHKKSGPAIVGVVAANGRRKPVKIFVLREMALKNSAIPQKHT